MLIRSLLYSSNFYRAKKRTSRHREHAILRCRKRVNKWMKRMNSLPLSPTVSSYVTLQGKPLPASPAKHCSAKLVHRPFRTLQFSFFYNNLTRVATLCLDILNAIQKFAWICKFPHETKQTQKKSNDFSTTWPNLLSNAFSTVGEF